MRLPYLDVGDADDVDVAIVGVPWDGGTTNRPGARHAPRALRDASTLSRNLHAITQVAPFELCNCADLGDVAVNPVCLEETMERVEAFFRALANRGIGTLAAGGDHLSTLPILRGLAPKQPLALVHFDAHSDTHDHFEGRAEFSHGTPFFHAINEGLIDSKRTIQIGIRGSAYSASDAEWARERGVVIVDVEDIERRGIQAVAGQIREVVGSAPVYVSFDVDCLDPVYAPGTGTPEIGGLTTREALRLVRSLRGLDIVGADLVEVSPPFDGSGLTAITGASFMFELLCLICEARTARLAAGLDPRRSA